MSGSRKAMIYRTDDNTPFCVQIDESNGEACGFGDVTVPSALGLPRNIKMRYALARHPDSESVKRKFYLGTITFLQDIASGTTTISTPDPLNPSGTVSWQVTAVRGERVNLFLPTDSGLNDGDAS